MRLTPRESQVAELIAASKTDKEIAAILGLSHHTVRGYVKQVFRKLGVHKRTAVYPMLQALPGDLPPVVIPRCHISDSGGTDELR